MSGATTRSTTAVNRNPIGSSTVKDGSVLGQTSYVAIYSQGIEISSDLVTEYRKQAEINGAKSFRDKWDAVIKRGQVFKFRKKICVYTMYVMAEVLNPQIDHIIEVQIAHTAWVAATMGWDMLTSTSTDLLLVLQEIWNSDENLNVTIKAVNTFKGGVIRKCMNAIKKMKQGMNSKTSFLWACTSSKADFWIGKGTKETAPQVGRNISAMMVKAYVVLMKKLDLAIRSEVNIELRQPMERFQAEFEAIIKLLDLGVGKSV